jgi:tellurite resistance protein TerC
MLVSAGPDSNPDGGWVLPKLENKSYKVVRKLIITMVGISVLLIGAAMIVLPGPAIIVIPAGLAILATEFGWARLFLRRLKEKIRWKTKTEADLI